MDGVSEDEKGVGEFGRLVKRYRLARSLSAERLSLMAGLSKGYVTLIETGRRGQRPGRDNVIALAQALRAPTVEFLRTAGLEPGDLLSPDERPTFREFVETDPSLRSDQKDVLIRTYETFVGRQDEAARPPATARQSR